MTLGSFGLATNGSAADLSITAAATTVCTPIIGLVGMQSLLVTLRFVYGSGGTSVKAYVQGSADSGNVWYDMACAAFAQTNSHRLLNLSAGFSRPATDATDGTLADDTIVDGLISDRVRLKVVSVGTYAGNTLLAARIVAR